MDRALQVTDYLIAEARKTSELSSAAGTCAAVLEKARSAGFLLSVWLQCSSKIHAFMKHASRSAALPVDSPCVVVAAAVPAGRREGGPATSP